MAPTTRATPPPSSPATRAPASRSGPATPATPATASISTSTRSAGPAVIATGASPAPRSTWATSSPTIPQEAAERVKAHASHFVHLVYEALQSGFNDAIPPILCSPFDAELFGHWWFEGALWLEAVARTLHDYDTGIAAHHLRRIPRPLSPRRLHRHARRLLGRRGQQPGLDEPRDLLDLHPHLPRRALHPRGLHRRPVARLRPRRAHRASSSAASSSCSNPPTGSSSSPPAPRATTPRSASSPTTTSSTRSKPSGRASSPPAHITPAQEDRLAEIERRDSVFPDIDPGLWVAGAHQTREAAPEKIPAEAASAPATDAATA